MHVAIHITTKFSSINWGGIFFLCLWLFQFNSPNRSSISLVVVMNVYMYYMKNFTPCILYISVFFLVWMLFWIHFLSCIPWNVPWVAFKPCKSQLVAWEWSPVLTVQMGLQVTGSEQKRECIYIYTLYPCFD
jgi:hypothetical protein